MTLENHQPNRQENSKKPEPSKDNTVALDEKGTLMARLKATLERVDHAKEKLKAAMDANYVDEDKGEVRNKKKQSFFTRRQDCSWKEFRISFRRT